MLVPVGPNIRAKAKRFKEALNRLIQEICADSKMAHFKLDPKEDRGLINVIKTIGEAD